MRQPDNQKVTTGHLERNAYVYVRQAAVQQTFSGTENTRRQYALRERAVTLGWPIERVQVVDTDLGRSGTSSAERGGFQTLVREIDRGLAGIVLAIDLSRLTRRLSEWHRLLQSCMLADTLVFVEDGVYNPNDFCHRLLLGGHGPMSETGLHTPHAWHRTNPHEVPA